LYDLFAITHHIGTMNGGHYVASCCVNGSGGGGGSGGGVEGDVDGGNGNVEGGSDEWYNFNDASVSKVDAKHIVSPTGYILFYKKRELSSANVINLSM
jgi:ubiquitin C-terminal hydrolase